MSNPVDYIEKYPERTTSILGINYQQWQKLTIEAMPSASFAIAYNQKQQQKLEKSKIRINATGAGRKAILTIYGLVRLRLGTFSLPP